MAYTPLLYHEKLKRRIENNKRTLRISGETWCLNLQNKPQVIVSFLRVQLYEASSLTLSYLRGHNTPPPLLFFLRYPKTPQAIKLKLSDFKDTPLRHLSNVIPVRYILSCYHGNKITQGSLQNLTPKKREKSVFCKDIELKCGIETNFGPLS